MKFIDRTNTLKPISQKTRLGIRFLYGILGYTQVN